MDFRTSKCNHNQRSRCINCLTKQLKIEKMQQQIKSKANQNKCVHPPNMKCLKCMQSNHHKMDDKYSKCDHPNYQRCKFCRKDQLYQTFQYFVQKLNNDCKHKKPCKKCVPIQCRKTFGIDLQCRNHIPYPQAQCQTCMAPIISIIKQPFTHVKKAVIKTSSVDRVFEAKMFGILLGYQQDGTIYVNDVYFPEQQQPNGSYLSPESLMNYEKIFELLGYSQVGILYCSPQLSALQLMLTSIFQEYFLKIDKNGYQISKFITMRLHSDNINPCFECFMVSDQFQVFHKNNLIFQTTNHKDRFDLITAKVDKNDKTVSLPSFLRAGVQTEYIYFKQIIVWIETEYYESFQGFDKSLQYPFFKIDEQDLDSMKKFISCEVSNPIQKFKNTQFLLHLKKLAGVQMVQSFLNLFIFDEPEKFLWQIVEKQERKQRMDQQRNPKYPYFGFNQ